jgi:hypothetical protein
MELVLFVCQNGKHLLLELLETGKILKLLSSLIHGIAVNSPQRPSLQAALASSLPSIGR